MMRVLSPIADQVPGRLDHLVEDSALDRRFVVDSDATHRCTVRIPA
jgi:hypothetical protein